MNIWSAVYSIDNEFGARPVACFADADAAVEWARENLPYAWVIRPCQRPQEVQIDHIVEGM